MQSWKALQPTFIDTPVNNETRAQADLCLRVDELRHKWKGETLSKVTCASIVSALEQFTECIRYLNTRRSTGAKLSLESEADVQDAIYLMLRPWVLDLIHESPTNKVGNRFAIKDFVSPSAKTVIEAKFIRDQAHGKHIAKEIHDDIEVYRHHIDCEHLIFFIYDPDSLIPNVTALKSELVVDRVYGGRALFCYLIVKP